ncbi:hypothetical protein LZ32DRAFT_628775 [Colletotrichum eremochloae]|nr:hypothetical protein LZ32DRAFT_628775 [Colletotrichum eremochloae]
MVTTNCRNSFSGLKLALVAGICRGVPFHNKGMQEIIIGDVIIRESAGSVTGRPPSELRGLINKLKGRRERRWMQKRTCLHLQKLPSGSSSEARVVHFGCIACADQIMKSGEDRDNIARETGVIAFETGGAGHKNRRRQNYTAATAAA